MTTSATRRLLPLLAALAAAVAGHATATGPDAVEQTGPKTAGKGLPVILVVNGEPVTTAQFEEALARMHADAPRTGRDGFDLDRLVFRVVNDVLIAQEARRLGMHEEEPTRGLVGAYREQLAVAMFRRREILDRAEPTDEQVRAAFDHEFARVTLRVLTCDTRDEADALLERLRAGEDFAALAKAHSVDSFSARGGLIENATRRNLRPELRQIVFALEPGALGGPVLTDAGWTILRLERFDPADPARFDEEQGVVRDRLRFAAAERLEKELVDRLAAEHPITIDDAVLAGLEPKRLSDGRLVPEVPDPAAIVARIEGVGAVSAEELAEALRRRWKTVRSAEAASASRRLVLDRLLRERLIRAEALARGFDRDPVVADRVRARENDLLAQRYLEEVLAAGIEIDRAAMEPWYENHKDRFRRPPRLRLTQITVADRATAEQVAELARSGTDPAWLARKHSIDRFADRGGDRGWYEPRPAVSEFERRLAEAQPGSVFGPEGAEGNWVVLIVTAREEQGHYGFREVSGNVRRAMFDEAFRRELHELITTLRKDATIEVREDELARLRIDGTLDEEPAQGGAHGHAGH
ncbi:MAG: hypothetical protein D6738_06410 [Acidobacteria bacterium]|nr:MAG: hypothetical protein D6738_06410 [Acidobacteriota bacterium]